MKRMIFLLAALGMLVAPVAYAGPLTTDAVETAWWDHDGDACNAAGSYNVEIVKRASPCGVNVICSATADPAATSTRIQTAAAMRTALTPVCAAAGITIAGNAATAVISAQSTNQMFDVCANGVKIVDRTGGIAQVAVCSTASGTQDAIGVYENTQHVPSLTSSALIGLSMLMMLGAFVAIVRRRRANSLA